MEGSASTLDKWWPIARISSRAPRIFFLSGYPTPVELLNSVSKLPCTTRKCSTINGRVGKYGPSRCGVGSYRVAQLAVLRWSGTTSRLQRPPIQHGQLTPHHCTPLDGVLCIEDHNRAGPLQRAAHRDGIPTSRGDPDGKLVAEDWG